MIYLVRHGETEANVEGRLQGRSDTPLTSRGRVIASRVGRLLRDEIAPEREPRLVSSPIGRAMTTAGLIARELGIEVGEIAQQPLLMEIDFGLWSGLSLVEVDERFPGEPARREEDKWNYQVPQGETYSRVFERATVWLESLDSDACTVAVTHEVVSRLLRGAYGGLSRQEMGGLGHRHSAVYRLENGSTTELEAGTLREGR